MMVTMAILVTTSTAEHATALPLHRGWLGRLARAGTVTPAETTPGGDMLWDVGIWARQLAELRAQAAGNGRCQARHHDRRTATMTGKRKARLARNLSDRSQMQQARQALAGKAGTTARGYGWQHQQRRTRALAALVDGEPLALRPAYVPRGRRSTSTTLSRSRSAAAAATASRTPHVTACAGAVLGGQLRARQAPRRAAQPARYTRW